MTKEQAALLLTMVENKITRKKQDIMQNFSIFDTEASFTAMQVGDTFSVGMMKTFTGKDADTIASYLALLDLQTELTSLTA